MSDVKYLMELSETIKELRNDIAKTDKKVKKKKNNRQEYLSQIRQLPELRVLSETLRDTAVVFLADYHSLVPVSVVTPPA